MSRALRVLAICLVLVFVAAGGRKYEVIERADRYLDKDGHQVSMNAFDHEEILFVVKHSGHKIYASCDLSTLNNLDPNATCAVRPLREYECALGKADPMKDTGVLSDLTCEDSDGHKVYLYVNRKD
jgi:hypothetical protein